MQISSVEFLLFLIAGAIVSAGWMIATAIRQLRSVFLHESQRMIDRFCDFAFEPGPGAQNDETRAIAEASQLRWIVRTIKFHRTGDWI
jgi:hypothetical protein